MYAYAGNNPVKYVDPDGESPFSFFMFDKEKFNWEFDEKCNTSKKVEINYTFTLYSSDYKTLEDFKDRIQWKESYIFDYGNEENSPEVLNKYKELLKNKNIIIVTEKKDITIKYKNRYDEVKSSELEHVIKIYEKVGDNYVEKDFGTGAVKITPAHDANDYEVNLCTPSFFVVYFM